MIPLKPGVYEHLSNEDYHASDGWSSSQLKKVVEWGPAGVHKKTVQTDAMLMGNVLHTLVLEPSEFEARYLFAPGLNLSKAVDKETYAELSAEAVATGRELIRQDPRAWKRSSKAPVDLFQVAAAVQRHPRWRRCIGENPVIERSYYWIDKATGLPCKVRPDASNFDFDDYVLHTDLKSALDPRSHAFQNSVLKYGYDLSAAYYCEGVLQTTGVPGRWAWFAFQTEPDYEVVLWTAGPDVIARGARLFRKALDELAKCIETDKWTGYSKGLAMTLNLPRWAQEETS